MLNDGHRGWRAFPFLYVPLLFRERSIELVFDERYLVCFRLLSPALYIRLAGPIANEEDKKMHLEVSLDYETSEHAGARGMFQIESVVDSETDDDLTGQVDVGVHFTDRAELEDYIRQEFGSEATFDIVGED